MLIVKVFVNNRQIDEIKIQNVSPIGHTGDFHEYKIRKPQEEDVVIKHLRSSGWMPLVKTVLGYLIKRGE